MRAFAEMGHAKEMEADGVWENIAWHGISAVKMIGDGVAHAADVIAPAMSGVGGVFTGEGFADAYGRTQQEMLKAFKTTDPDSVDLLWHAGKRLGLLPETTEPAGRIADRLVQEKLGWTATISQTLGFLASFATGPGARIGQAGAAGADRVATGIAHGMSKVVARWAKKGDRNAFSRMIDQGQAWNRLTSTPAWKKSAGLLANTLALGKRNIREMVSLTGANMLQSYMLNPDEERLHGLVAAAELSWAMAPLAKMGEGISKILMTPNLTNVQKDALVKAYHMLDAGKLSMRGFGEAVQKIAPTGAVTKAVANLAAGSLEGTAFMGLDPRARELASKWWSGDAEAGAQLFGMWAGTVPFIAAMKYKMPHDMAPLFKQVRPDLNTLRIRMEAHANEIAQKKGIEAQEAHDQVTRMFTWADLETRSTLRGHWETEFVEHQGPQPKEAQGKRLGELALRYDSDHKVTIRNEGSDLVVDLPDNVRKILNDAGVEVSEKTLRGDDARMVLDDLALVGMLMRQSSAMSMQKRGFGEVEGSPGVYKEPGGNRYYTARLDGKHEHRGMFDDGAPVVDDTFVAPGFDDPLWNNPIADQLTKALQAKRVIAPDALVDGIISNAIHVARHGRGRNADQIREFLDTADPEQVIGMLNAEADRLLAMDLGSLSTGTHNAKQMGEEMATQLIDARARQHVEAQEAFAERLMSQDRPGEQDSYPGVDPEIKQRERVAEVDERVAEADRVREQESETIREFEARERDMDRDMAAQEDLGDRLTQQPHKEGVHTQKVSPQDQLLALRKRRHTPYLEAMEEAAPLPVADDGPVVKQPKESFSKADVIREQMMDAAVGVDPDASVTVRITSDQVDTIRQFVPKDSDLGRQLDSISDRGDVTVSGKDAARLAKLWAKYAPTELAKKKGDVGFERLVQSTDAWVGKLVKGLGGKFSTAAEPARRPKYLSLSEQMQRRLREPGKKPPEEPQAAAKLRDDASPQDYAGSVGLTPQMAKGLRQGVKKLADYVFGGLTGRLKRMGAGDIAYRIDRMKSNAALNEGRILDVARELESLFRSKEGVALRKEYVQNVKTDAGFQRTRWQELFDGNVKPRSDFEKKVAELGQKMNRVARDIASDAGAIRNVRGKGGLESQQPVRKGGKSVTQYVKGEDFATVMDDNVLRREFFDRLAKAETTLFVKSDDGKMRKATGEDLDREFLAEQESLGKGSSAAREAAVEFSRRFKKMPALWKSEKSGKTYAMLEQNPYAAMHTIASRQGGRAAAIKEFGVDAGAQKDVLLAKAREEGWPQHTIDAIERGGVNEAIRVEVERLNDVLPTQADVQSAKSMLEQLMARSQGSESVESWLKNAPVAKQLLSGFQSLRSSFLASMAFTQDVGDLVARPFMMNAKRSIRALLKIAETGKDYENMLMREGIIQNQLGDWKWQEARGWARSVSDIIGKPQNWTERLKTKVAAKNMELLIEDIRNGKATATDHNFVEFLLEMSPENVAAVRAGKVSPELAQQIMREGTMFLTSRGRKGDYSAWADNPNVTQFMLFQRFATKRAESHFKMLGEVFRATEKYGKNSPEAWAARRRLVKMSMGITAAGLAGKAITEWAVGVLSGEGNEGARKFATDLMNNTTHTILSGVENQVVGGPAASVTRIMKEPKNADNWSGLTSPTAMGAALIEVSHRMVAGDHDAVAALAGGAEAAGLVPFRRPIKSMAAYLLGEDPEYRVASRYVWQWRRLNDKLPAHGGSKAHDDAFYEAVRGALKHFRNGMDRPDGGLKETMEEIRKALDLAPGESVAASIRGRRLIAGLDTEDRESLFASIPSDEQIRYINQHDALLTRLARDVSREEGRRPDDLDQEIERVIQQASLGAGDKWHSLIDRVLDESSALMEDGRQDFASLEYVANSLAHFPEHLEQAGFSGRDLRRMGSPTMDSATRGRFIYNALRRRAVDRYRKESMEQQRQQ